MSAARVSVVIPAHNAGGYLVEAVEGLLAQSHPAHEIIVIDDGSTDDTAERMAHYGDALVYRRVEQAHLPGTQRVAAARNQGLALASGELVAFLDADDRAAPSRLESQVALLEASPEAAFAYATLQLVDRWGRPVRSLLSDDRVGRGRSGAHRIYQALLLGNLVPTSSVLARTEPLRQIGGFRADCVYAEDWDLWLRLAARWPVVYDPAPVGDYRVYEAEDALRRVFDRGKARGLAEVVRHQLLAEDGPAVAPDLAARALGLALWRGALIALAVGERSEGRSLLSGALAELPDLPRARADWDELVWTAVEGAAFAADPMDRSEDLLDRMLVGLPADAWPRRRLRRHALGLLRSHAARRAAGRGRTRLAARLALAAVLADPVRRLRVESSWLLREGLARRRGAPYGV